MIVLRGSAVFDTISTLRATLPTEDVLSRTAFRVA